jgi:hypothetical protein
VDTASCRAIRKHSDMIIHAPRLLWPVYESPYAAEESFWLPAPGPCSALTSRLKLQGLLWFRNTYGTACDRPKRLFVIAITVCVQ